MSAIQEKPINARCPFSGKPVAAGAQTRYRGYPVAFCNEGCRDDFDKAITLFDELIANAQAAESAAASSAESESAASAESAVATVAAVRPAAAADGDAVAAIYNHYVTNTAVTFDEKEIPAAEVARRIADDPLPFVVAEVGGDIVGYAVAAGWKSRCAYRGAAEVGIYVAGAHHRNGVGGALLTALLARLAQTHHTAIACVALPNPASVALFEKHGFAKAGHFRQVGRKFGKFIDTGYWQKILGA